MATTLRTAEVAKLVAAKASPVPMYNTMHGGGIVDGTLMAMPSELPPTVMYTLKTPVASVVLSGDSYVYVETGGCRMLTAVKHLANNTTTIPKVYRLVNGALVWETLDVVLPYKTTPEDKLVTINIQTTGSATFVNGFIVR